MDVTATLSLTYILQNDNDNRTLEVLDQNS